MGFSKKNQVTVLYLSQLPVRQLHDCAICNMCLHHTTVYLIYLVYYLFSKRVTLMQTIDFLLFLLILNIKLFIITCEYSSVQIVCVYIVCYVILSHCNNINVTFFKCSVSFYLSTNWESWITVIYLKISVNG